MALLDTEGGVPQGASDHAAAGQQSDGTIAQNGGLRALLVSILLTGALAAGVLLALTPHYETNDDVGMNEIVAGRYIVDHPDEHLLFSNVLIGLALRRAYESFPNVPWYGAYLFLTACLSLGAITFVCLQRGISEWNLGLAGVFLWVAGAPALTTLQFTREGFLAGFAGLVLLVGAVVGKTSRIQPWLAIPFLLVGSLIRLSATLLACVVALPLLVWMVGCARRDKMARTSLAILFACLVAGALADRFNTWYYDRDPAWHDFYRYNALRAEFTDFGHLQYNARTASAFESVGWLPIDLEMARRWATLDSERFNTRTFTALFDASRTSRWRMDKTWGPLFAHCLRDGELWGLWALGALCVLAMAPVSSVRFVPVLCYAAAGVVCLALYQVLHLPPRVYCPVFLACAVVPLALAGSPRSFGAGRAWVESRPARAVLMLLLAALLLGRGWAMWRTSVNLTSFHKQEVQILDTLKPQPSQLYVIWGADFPHEYVSFPFEGRTKHPGFRVLGLDCTCATPFGRARMAEFGFSDWLSFVRGGGQKYLICEKDTIKLLREYLRAHDGVEIDSQVVFWHPGLYSSVVFRLSPARTPSRPDEPRHPATRSPSL